MARKIIPSDIGKSLFESAQSYAATLPVSDRMIGLLEALSQGTYDDAVTRIVVSQDITADLSNQCNGVANDFTMPQTFVATTLRVYWNGLRQTLGSDVTVTGSTTFSATFTPDTGDNLIVDYRIL